MDSRKFTVAEIIMMIRNGDTSPFYNSRYWRNLSHAVIKENHKECIPCRRKGIVVTAVLTHHVNELKLRPDLAYERQYTDEKGNKQMQLMPVCFDCHERIHKRGLYAETDTAFHYTNEERW